MNERIVIDPKICHGKPVVRGTRNLRTSVEHDHLTIFTRSLP